MIPFLSYCFISCHTLLLTDKLIHLFLLASICNCQSSPHLRILYLTTSHFSSLPSFSPPIPSFSFSQHKKMFIISRCDNQEIKSMQLEEVLNERADEEMEVSDSDMEGDSAGPSRRKFPRMDEDIKAIESLKEENDSLRCQLEAYKNEVDLVRSDSMAEVALRDQQTQLLKQTLQGMQQQLLEAKRKQVEDERSLKDLETKLAKVTSTAGSPLSSSAASSSTDGPSGSGVDDGLRVADPLTERDARLIGLVSTFLHVHPFGAGVDYVWSYLQKIEPSLRPSDVEALLSRFPSLFRQELSGIGANMERKWLFAGFTRPIPSSAAITVSASSTGVVPSSGS